MNPLQRVERVSESIPKYESKQYSQVHPDVSEVTSEEPGASPMRLIKKHIRDPSVILSKYLSSRL